MINPAVTEIMYDFYFEIFKEWDEESNQASVILATSEAHELGNLRPVPSFILQDGSSSEQEYVRTVISMNTTMEQFMEDGGEDKFEESIANSLGIDKMDVVIMDLQEGSVIVDYNIFVNPNSPFDVEELI